MISRFPKGFSCSGSVRSFAINAIVENGNKGATGSVYPSALTYLAKDNICTKDFFTTCASSMLTSYTSPFDATVIQLLSSHRLVGKANMDEFGMGSFNINSVFGPALNPRYDTPHTTGGSSGGSAAAVAAGLVDFALGTDTGGSVRLPAAYCGVYGFKPSYGRISRWGVVAYAQSFDCVGILARDVSTIARVFGLLDQHDEKDPTSLDTDVRGRLPVQKKTKLVFGVPQECLVEEMADSVREAWLTVLESLIDDGHTVVPVSIPSIKVAIPAYYTLCTAEAASNLARFDGVRYGNKHRSIVDARTAELGDEVQRRIILGNYTLSSASGAHYNRATQIRRTLVEEFNGVFSAENAIYNTQRGDSNKCDYIVCPVATTKAPRLEECGSNMNEYVNDVFTVPASMGGLPVMTVPVGDVGIQVVGQFGDDGGVLEVAESIRQPERSEG